MGHSSREAALGSGLAWDDGGQVASAAGAVAAVREEASGLGKRAAGEVIDVGDAGLGELPGDEAAQVAVGTLSGRAHHDGLTGGSGLELNGHLVADLEGGDRQDRGND